MNYELAKKIKDSGFIYSNQLHRAFKPDGSFRNIGDSDEGEYVYEPTLEELIEACLRSSKIIDFTLKIAQGEGFTMKWVAHTYPFDMEGSTPLEAVTALWLNLALRGEETK